MIRRTLVTVTVAMSLVSFPARADEGVIHRLGWLAGCWQQGEGSWVSHEHWMPPSGGTMIGMTRTVANEKTVAYEFLRIEERDGRLVYIANPSGQAEAEFAQTEISDSSVAFSNPVHDFPQRIQYRLLEDGSILARIDGESRGETRTVDFPMRRCAARESALE